MELVVKHQNLPLRAYPPKALDEFLETPFKYWLANLINLKADKDEAVTEALEGVKVHAWSMGMVEIKKAFEMYVDSKLPNLEPLSGHMDRILVGKIMSAYKAEQQTRTKSAKTDADLKRDSTYALIEMALGRFKQTGEMPERSSEFYNFLTKEGKIQLTDKQREIYLKLANQDKAIAKLICLKDYFTQLKNK